MRTLEEQLDSEVDKDLDPGSSLLRPFQKLGCSVACVFTLLGFWSHITLLLSPKNVKKIPSGY